MFADLSFYLALMHTFVFATLYVCVCVCVSPKLPIIGRTNHIQSSMAQDIYQKRPSAF